MEVNVEMKVESESGSGSVCGCSATHLAIGREQTEDIVDTVLETTRQHLVGFVEHKLTDFVDLQCAAVDHVKYATWCAHDAVDARCESAHVVSNARATSTGHALDFHAIVTDCDNHLKEPTDQSMRDESAVSEVACNHLALYAQQTPLVNPRKCPPSVLTRSMYIIKASST